MWKKRLQEKNLNNLKQSEKELYGINLTECKMTGYQLLTDDGGNVFRHLAARTAKKEKHWYRKWMILQRRYSKRKLRAGKWNGRRTFRRGKQNNRGSGTGETSRKIQKVQKSRNKKKVQKIQEIQRKRESVGYFRSETTRRGKEPH